MAEARALPLCERDATDSPAQALQEPRFREAYTPSCSLQARAESADMKTIIVGLVCCGCFLYACGHSRSDKKSRSDEAIVSAVPSLPAYTLLEETIEDRPAKAMVRQSVAIHSLSEANVRQLLLGLYKQAMARTFKHHTRPTVVAIFVYASREHFDSGVGIWEGMLSKNALELEPVVTIREYASRNESGASTNEPGIDEARRKEVFVMLVQAERRAEVDAGIKYSRFSLEWYDFSTELRKQYEADIARRYELTSDQMKAIAIESYTKNWPLPPRD